MKKRIEWIDRARGIGMILVIFAHTPIPEKLGKYIYSFHIPLFFFLAGTLFIPEKYDSSKEFLYKKYNGLIIPYLWFFMINYLFWIIYNIATNQGSIVFYQPLLNILNPEKTPNSGVLWFILCLLCTEYVFYLAIKMVDKNLKKMILPIIGLTIFGIIYNYIVKTNLPMTLNIALISVSFYAGGYLFVKSNIFEKLKVRNNITIGILFLISIIFAFINKKVEMAWGVIGNPAFFYISAFSGCLYIVLLVEKLPKINIIDFIGRNSLVYLALHYFIVFTSINMVLGYFQINLLDNKKNAILVGIFYTVLTIFILTYITHFINKFLPFILGSRGEKKKTI